MSAKKGLGRIELERKLRALELKFDRELRARGFEPAQAEHIALPSALARLYDEREELRTKLEELSPRDTNAEN